MHYTTYTTGYFNVCWQRTFLCYRSHLSWCLYESTDYGRIYWFKQTSLESRLIISGNCLFMLNWTLSPLQYWLGTYDWPCFAVYVLCFIKLRWPKKKEYLRCFLTLDLTLSSVHYWLVTLIQELLWFLAEITCDLVLQNLTMIHLPATNSCFLSDSIDDVPKPATLVKLLVINYRCWYC